MVVATFLISETDRIRLWKPNDSHFQVARNYGQSRRILTKPPMGRRLIINGRSVVLAGMVELTTLFRFRHQASQIPRSPRFSGGVRDVCAGRHSATTDPDSMLDASAQQSCNAASAVSPDNGPADREPAIVSTATWSSSVKAPHHFPLPLSSG